MSRHIGILLLFCFPLTPRAALSDPLQITIASPRDGADVPLRPCVSGTTSDPEADHFLIIHPMDADDFWVQPSISIRSNEYKVEAYVGEPEQDEGKRFELRMIANPLFRLREGQKLAGWPPARAFSPIIEVVRHAGAPNGCEEPISSPAAVVPSTLVNPTIVDAGSSAAPRPPITIAPGLRRPVLDLGWLAAVVPLFVIALLVMFSACRERADGALKRLTLWLVTFRNWLITVALVAKASTVQLCTWLQKRCVPWIQPVWQAKGFNGNLRDFALRVLMVPLLSASLALAFYADASTIVRGLNPLFGIETSQGSNSPDSGIVGNLMKAGGRQRVDESTLEPKSAAASSSLRQLLTHLARAYEALWSGEKLGFLAIALACLQAAFGIVLLWRMGFDQPLRVRPLALLGERPLVMSCFVILNIALSVLAANRGFELSPDAMNWVMPSVVSGGIALVMPWILAYSLHYAIECSADCLAVTKAVGLIAGLIAMMFAAISVWTLALLLIIAAVGALFVAFFLVYVTACSFLLLAELVNDFVGMLRRPSRLRRAAVSLAMPALIVLMLLAGGGYLMRGVIP